MNIIKCTKFCYITSHQILDIESDVATARCISFVH